MVEQSVSGFNFLNKAVEQQEQEAESAPETVTKVEAEEEEGVVGASKPDQEV